MKLSELFLNRYLYRDNTQSEETPEPGFVSADSSEEIPTPIASGGAAQDINTGTVQIDGAVIEDGTVPGITRDLTNIDSITFTDNSVLENKAFGLEVYTASGDTLYLYNKDAVGALASYFEIGLNVRLFAAPGIAGAINGGFLYLGTKGGESYMDGYLTGIGGDVEILAGRGGATSGNAGFIELTAGAARGGNSYGGDVVVKGGASAGTRDGGNVNLQGATGGATGDGGRVYFSGGTGGATSGDGGNIEFYPGDEDGSGNKGVVYAEGDVQIANAYSLQLPYRAGAPGTLANGMVWMESDGLHLYYNGAEKLVVGV